MTVSAQDLADFSPFKVSEEITAPTYINNSQFEKYAALAKKKLDRDNPGLSTEEYDHAHALLIAHYVAARTGTLERTSERLDNYSYNKEAGTSSFLLQYKALIEETGAEIAEPTQLIAHSDTFLGDMKLDQAALPLLFDRDDVDGEPEEP